MTTKRILPHGVAFTTLHGVLEYGSDPSDDRLQPPPKHLSTVTSQTMSPQGERDFIALVGPGYAAQTASLVVADNDFSDRAVIILGDYELISNVDYLVGGGVVATATAIAAAIDLLPEFTAQGVGATVNITREPSMERVEFRVLHLGAVTNFTPLVPVDGWMDPGAPDVSPVVVT